jgi:hypothetical protein
MRSHERHQLSETASFVIIGSIENIHCIDMGCMNAQIHEATNERILLLTEQHLKPGTFVKVRDFNDQQQIAVVLWSLMHNNSYKTELLII